MTLSGACVNLPYMKTASLRHLQHHLSEVIRWVDHGEEVLVTRRNRVIARLVPASPSEKTDIAWPDFAKRANRIKVKGRQFSESLLEERKEQL